MSHQDLGNTLDYIHSEINRIETMAGTLATTEQEHFKKLSNFDDPSIKDIASETQSAARQLGTMKQMCLAMSQKIEATKNANGQGEISRSNDHE